MHRGMVTLVSVLTIIVLVLTACAPAAAPATPTTAPAPKTEPTAAAPKVAPTPTAPPPAPAAKQEKLKMASSSLPGMVSMAQDVARKKGFYTQENLDVEINQLKADVAVKAMVAGEVDFTLNIGSVIRAAAQGVPVKGVLVSIAKPYHVVMVRPEIKEGRDLKGKSIGVDTIGGTPEYLARVAAISYGLDPDKDVTMTALGGNPERLSALKGGAVQATIIEALYAYKAENEGMKRLTNTGDIIDMAVGGIGASEKMIKERPDAVLRVVRATAKGLKYMKDPKNKDEIMDYMVKELGANKEEAAATYPDMIRTFSDDGSASDASIMTNVKEAIERAGAKPNTTLGDVFDSSFVKKVKEGS